MEGSMNEVFTDPFSLHNFSIRPPFDPKQLGDLSSKQNERFTPLLRRNSSTCNPSLAIASFPRSLSRHPTAAILYTFNLTSRQLKRIPRFCVTWRDFPKYEMRLCWHLVYENITRKLPGEKCELGLRVIELVGKSHDK